MEPSDRDITPGEALLKSLEDSDLVNSLLDITESGLDKLLDDGLLRDLPLVGSIVGITRFGLHLKEYLLLKKVLSFLVYFAKTKPEDRKKLVERLNQNAKERRKISDQLLLAIDRLDRVEKSEILAAFFAAFLNSDITRYEFEKLSSALDRINLQDISLLSKFYVDALPKSEQEASGFIDLVNLGLIAMSYPSMVVSDFSSKPRKEKCELGHLFLNICPSTYKESE